MVLKFESADRVGNPLDRILLSVGKIVSRINSPVRAGLVMCNVTNAIQNGVSEIHIGRGHINFCAQHLCTFGKYSRAHLLE